MSWSINQFLSYLKQVIKNRKTTYKEIAEYLNVSEITVKRLLNSEDPSMASLIKVCDFLQIPFDEMVKISQDLGQKSHFFSLEQEQQFTEDIGLYYFFTEIRFKELDHVIEKYHLAPKVVTKRLRQLEKMQLIKMTTNQKYKILVSTPTLSWIKDGPLQKKFMLMRHVEYANVFTKNVGKTRNYITSTEAQLSEESIIALGKEFADLAKKYVTIARREGAILSAEKMFPVAWLAGVGEFHRDYGEAIRNV